jgi:vancomycin resistance protein YoaR
MAANALNRKNRASLMQLTLQILVALIGGVLIFFLLAGAVTFGFNTFYSGRIYPGVSVAGNELSGLTFDQAAQILSQKIIYPVNGRIVFQDGSSNWTAAPHELGLVFDAQSSAKAAYETGRKGDPITRLFHQVRAWRSGVNLAPLMIYDERVAYDYVGNIADQVELQVVEAKLEINGGEVVEKQGQIGRRVEISATVAALGETLNAMTDGIVPLVVEDIQPEIQDVSEEAQLARQILSQPILFNLPDAAEDDLGPWRIEPEQVGRMLQIERVADLDGARYQVGFDQKALNTYLSALGPDIAQDPQDARFIFNDDTHLLEVIKPAVTGRVLDVHATIQEVVEQVPTGTFTIPLVVSYIDPEITDDTTGEQLGITELVSWHTTYFRGSITERLNNIEVAAANFHGLLVPPGETFSMASVMGNVSLDSGYEEAWIIFGGRTIKGVGGGVCQVSTTLFRTVFFGGYPIVERYPHAYRVGYYEQTVNGADENLAGLDATVFVPMVDFKFRNDTPYYILMETYVNPGARSLTWKFYSTSDGREVEWETSGPTNVVEPPEPKFEENPELSQGEIRQVDWAAEGADVTVTRRVIRDNVVLYEDVFTTHYQPWRDVYQFGPGTEIKNSKFFWKNKPGSG